MKKINVNLETSQYDIFIENGLINNLGVYFNTICESKKIVVVTDSNVDKLYYSFLEKSLKNEDFQVEKIVVPAGEASKSFKILMEVYDNLATFKVNRGSTIVALGGGVIGDLTGFAASTFLRGVPFIQIPTSLLAQVDSSVGGKVAVNLPQGKNLVGSFYQPKAVFIDPQLLNSLEDKFFYDGLSEVIKYGAIKDSDLFSQLLSYNNKEELLGHMEDIIYTCCSIKASIVEVDEKDTGERMLLNFGHTIGHAIEKYYNYEKYTHGEAVAIGMYKITAISEQFKLTETGTKDKIKEILIKYNLPWNLENFDEKSIIDAISFDKKNIGNGLFVVLIKDIGNSFLKKLEGDNINNFFNS